MNNINCEHCGSLIDIEKDIKCPNCGAPYKNNKQYKEFLEYQKKQKEANLESQRISNEIKKDEYKTKKKMTSGVVVVMIIMFIMILSVLILIVSNFFREPEITNNNIINLNKDNTNVKQEEFLEEFFGDGTSTEDKILVFYNETAKTDKFDIKTDRITKYNYNKNEYYGFHIIFKNKTDDWKNLSNIKLSYIDKDGDTQNIRMSHIPTKTINMIAMDKTTYNGFVYFDIPDYVEDVTLIYNNVNISIQGFKELIK